MNARRGFLKNLGLFGAAVAGASAAAANNIARPAETVGEKIDHLAPNNNTTFQLQATNREYSSEAMRIDGSGNLGIGTRSPLSGLSVDDLESPSSFYFVPQPTPSEMNKVELSVGKDNRLWTKVDGQWKRLAIE